MQNRLMRRLLVVVLLCGLGALVWLSLHLAAFRIYQVDECTETYVARILATKQAGTHSPGHVTLFQVLLSTVLHGSLPSADLLTSGRFLMLEIFWLNSVLIALATREKLFSLRGLAALLGAATLAPLWDYGFEIRHDNLLLSGLLLMWCLIRLRAVGVQSALLTGALAAGMQFVAFKAFAYTVPLSLAIFVFPPPGLKASRWKLAVAWVGGALGMFLTIRVALGVAGLWDLYVSGSQFLGAVSGGGRRFGPWKTLARLLGQTPLLLALLTAALVTAILELRRRGKAALTWEGNLPEAALFVVALAALLINPAPFPYNLLFLVPFVFVFAFRYAMSVLPEVQRHPTFALLAAAVLLFSHLVPFGIATKRHLGWPNSRQTKLMAFAESLTDPATDHVFDGAFLVVARPVDSRWFIHSFNIQRLTAGEGPRVRDLLAEKPATVIMPNYRTDWLQDEDHEFIREHYVSLADDFWVLGKVLPSGGGEYQVIHPGRYRISPLNKSCLAGTYSYDLKGLIEMSRLPSTNDPPFVARLNGQALADKPVELKAGTHRIQTMPDCQPAVVWVGPSLDRPPLAGPGDHRTLFVNWY